AINASLWNPAGLVQDTIGNIYFSDLANNRVRRINLSGIIQTIAGQGTVGFSGDGFWSIQAQLNGPFGLAAYKDNLYIADQGNSRIRKITKPEIASVNEIDESQNAVSIYPNPSNGIFNLSIRKYQLGIENTIEIYNTLGERIYSTKFSTLNSQLSIDISNRPSGLYLYRVLSKEGNVVGEGKLITE